MRTVSEHKNWVKHYGVMETLAYRDKIEPVRNAKRLEEYKFKRAQYELKELRKMMF